MTRTAALLLLLTTACVEDLAPETDPSDDTDVTDTGDTDDTGEPADGKVVFEGPDGSGTTVATIDATGADDFVYVDLATSSEADGEAAWTLGFQRYTVIVDGGISGDGDVEAVFVADAAFDSSPPTDGWATDAPDADDDGKDELVFGSWYDYNPENHVLTPKAGTWFVRDAEHVWAVQILDYYSEAGDGGYPEIRFREL